MAQVRSDVYHFAMLFSYEQKGKMLLFHSWIVVQRAVTPALLAKNSPQTQLQERDSPQHSSSQHMNSTSPMT